MAHFLDTRFDLRVDETAPGKSIFEQRENHLGQQVVGFAHISIMAENTGLVEIPEKGIIILNGVEDNGVPWVLTPDFNCGLDTVELTLQVDIHQNCVRWLRGKTKSQGFFTTPACIDDLNFTGGFKSGY